MSRHLIYDERRSSCAVRSWTDASACKAGRDSCRRRRFSDPVRGHLWQLSVADHADESRRTQLSLGARNGASGMFDWSSCHSRTGDLLLRAGDRCGVSNRRDATIQAEQLLDRHWRSTGWPALSECFAMQRGRDGRKCWHLKSMESDWRPRHCDGMVRVTEDTVRLARPLRTGRHVVVDETPHRCGSGLRARLWGLIWPSLDHSWITHSRKRTVPRGHRRTRRPRHLSSGGPQRSRQDTRGHGADTVRDREDEGSNPSPPTIFVFEIGDFCGPLESAEHSWITISRGATESRSPDRVFRLLR